MKILKPRYGRRSLFTCIQGHVLTWTLAMSQSRSQLVDQELLEPDLRARDHELTEIAKSIATLAELFKDLSSLVIDQGTLLDSVEYNIEQTGVHMNEAVKELEIATRSVPSRVASDNDSSLIASPSFSFWVIRSTGTRRILAGGSASSFSCSSSLGSYWSSSSSPDAIPQPPFQRPYPRGPHQALPLCTRDG